MRSARFSDETSGPSHAWDRSECLMSLRAVDRPRRARADVVSPPCFLVDRPSTTDDRHIPGGALEARPDRLLVFPTRPGARSLRPRWCEAFLGQAFRVSWP